MSPTDRFFYRLRRRALRTYEFALYGALVALALAVVWPADVPAADDEAVQCGQIQSSTVVMVR
jgi:hypothetical protein